MFLPENVNTALKEEEIRKAAFKDIEKWSSEIIPPAIRPDCVVSVQELLCGDPQCSPIDTAVTLTFTSGSSGIFGIPMKAMEVTPEELRHSFPTTDVLEKWHKGEDAEWPPLDDEESDQMPQLRFSVGTRVQCRIGPDATNDWADGTVCLLWYREPNWPKGSFAPYKIELDDGREIFAPGDMDQIIRKKT